MTSRHPSSLLPAAVLVVAAMLVALNPVAGETTASFAGIDENAASLTVDEAAARSGMTPEELIAQSRAMDVVDVVERSARENAAYLGSEYAASRRTVVVSWVAGQAVPDAVKQAGSAGISVEVATRDAAPGVGQWIKSLGTSRPPTGIGAISFDRTRLGFVVSVKADGPYASAGPDELKELLKLPAAVVEVKTDSGLGGALSRWSDGGAFNPGARAVNTSASPSLPCTTGFKVQQDISGDYALLTAAHCAIPDGQTT